MGIQRLRWLSDWDSRGPNVLYAWKKTVLHRAGPAARTLGDRVAQLEDELRRVERERDILKKALAILSRHA